MIVASILDDLSQFISNLSSVHLGPLLLGMACFIGYLSLRALAWRNILQAADYAGRHEWKDKCADLTHALAGFLEIRAYWDEAIVAHTLALQAGRDLADPARTAQASLELSEVSQQTGRYEAALPLAEDAAGIFRSLADRRGEADALDQIGMAHQRAGRS